LAIPLEQFLQFSPLQIAGVIELKGGLPNIINQKWSAGLSSRAPDAPGIGVGYKIEEEES
jgi:hypothetical protein